MSEAAKSTGSATPATPTGTPGLSTPPPADPNGKRARLSDFVPGQKATGQNTVAPPTGEPSMFLQEGADKQAAPASGAEGTTANPEGADEPSMFLDEPAGDPETQTSAQELAERAQRWVDDQHLDMEAFGEKLIELKDKHGVEYRTVNELRQNGLRLSDYSRMSNEVKQKDQQLTQAAQAYQQHLQEVGADPIKFAETYEEHFGTEHMMKVATFYAEREQQDQRLIRGAAIAAVQSAMDQYGIQDANDPRLKPVADQAAEQMRQRITNERNAQLSRGKEQRQRQLDEQRRAKEAEEREVAQLAQRYQQQLQQLGPVALKSVRLNWEHPKVKQQYIACVQEAMRLLGANEITRPVAQDAATLLAERLRAQHSGQRQTASNVGNPMNPGRQAGAGGGVRGAAGSVSGRARLSEFKPGR